MHDQGLKEGGDWREKGENSACPCQKGRERVHARASDVACPCWKGEKESMPHPRGVQESGGVSDVSNVAPTLGE